jgi:hypothetical protein
VTVLRQNVTSRATPSLDPASREHPCTLHPAREPPAPPRGNTANSRRTLGQKGAAPTRLTAGNSHLSPVTPVPRC